MQNEPSLQVMSVLVGDHYSIVIHNMVGRLVPCKYMRRPGYEFVISVSCVTCGLQGGSSESFYLA